MADADQVTVRSSRVIDTGGTVVFEDAFAIGIEVFGPGCKVISNMITGLAPTGIGEGVGISLSCNGKGCVVHSNIVRQIEQSRTTRTFALWISQPDDGDVSVVDNIMSGVTYAFWIYRDRARAWPNNISVSLLGNALSEIDCSPVDLPVYYRGLHPSNTFSADRPGCSDTVAYRASMFANSPDDPRALFALAIAHYQYFEGLSETRQGGPTVEEHVIRQRAIPLLRKAGELGFQEARRLLPRIEAFVANEARQLSLDRH